MTVKSFKNLLPPLLGRMLLFMTYLIMSFIFPFFTSSYLLHPRILLHTFIQEFSLCWKELRNVITLWRVKIFCLVPVTLLSFLWCKGHFKSLVIYSVVCVKRSSFPFSPLQSEVRIIRFSSCRLFQTVFGPSYTICSSNVAEGWLHLVLCL